MRAVEESRPLETRMPVQVETQLRCTADERTWLEGLNQSKVLRRAGHHEFAKARLYLLPAGVAARRKSAVPMLGLLPEETWVLVGENGELIAPPHRRSEPGVTQILLENLQKIALFRLVLDMRNEKSALVGKVEVELLRWTGARVEKPEIGADGYKVFYEGDELALSITNRHDEPLFIYVLDLGLTGRIQQAYPVLGAEDSLAPGRTIEVGTRRGEELPLYIPEEFPFTAAGCGDDPVEGIETLKVFVTTHPADFQPLLQAACREWESDAPLSIAPGPASSLEALLAVTFGGGGYRDFRRPVRRGGSEDWTTLERSFRLRWRAVTFPMAAGGRGG